MEIADLPTRTLRPVPGMRAIEIIDQTALPHACRTLRLTCLDEAAHAIRTMQVRGAPLIGVTAAYGLALGLSCRADDATLTAAVDCLAATRPTAVNLGWALDRMIRHLHALPPDQRAEAAWTEASRIAEADIESCRKIGDNGLSLLRPMVQPGRPLQLMTHCNAGWLATIDHGTALAPIYAAFDAGLDVHVWVSETRPRNQGLLTAWELTRRGVPHTVIADNAAGFLMAEGQVNAVIVGADRIAANGDTANKVGTCLKALAAQSAGVPFYVAAPCSTLDFDCPDGHHIPIEARDGDELRLVTGLDDAGAPACVRQIPASTAVSNPAFDVTPAALIGAIITECGNYPASLEALRPLSAKSARD